MIEFKEDRTPVIHADGGLEFGIYRNGIETSLILPPNSWTVEDMTNQINTRIEQENAS